MNERAPSSSSSPAAQAAALSARDSYGRLLALLSARARDVRVAEDALGDAFAAALSQWPHSGVPDNPDAWLLTAARRRLVDGWRKDGVRARDEEAVSAHVERLLQDATEHALPDDRLRLLFVCTHPAIEEAAQVPLMLQTVLGLDAATIASAFAVAPKTMGQRLWRAKKKIHDAGVPFHVPEPAERTEQPERLDAVLEAIYAAYGLAWDDVDGAGSASGLRDEALFLARLLAEQMPDEPEALGLWSLLLFAHARRDARRSDDGRYVPLREQDTARWHHAEIARAEKVLARAATLGRLGAFQLEAALQSASVDGVRRGRVDHEGVLHLYDGLAVLAPNLGVFVGRAAALLEHRGPDDALRALDAIEPRAAAEAHQPYWAVRAFALQRRGDRSAADHAFDRAMGLCDDDAVRRFLAERRAAGDG